jgi:hypothetical protein
MKLTYVLLPGFLLVFLSCSSTKIIQNPDSNSELTKEFYYLAEHRTGIIILKSGKEIVTDHIALEENQIKFKCSSCDSLESISPEDVNIIYFKDHLASGFQGALAGALSGLTIGLATIDRDADMAGLGAAVLMLHGTLLGATTGGLIGSKIKYKIE